MTCCFFGHRDCPDLSDSLIRLIEGLIVNEGATRFYVGSQGRFDHMAQITLAALEKEYPDITCLEVLAYMPGKKAEFEIPKRLDTVYPDGLEEVPRKFAIDKRNRWMVQNSDMVICYIDHSYGGAAKFVELARRQEKRIINLAQILDS